MFKKHDSNIDIADILIVDDESANLKLLSEMLVMEGYRVRPANSPRLAIESALGKPPDLILLDIRMPEMDGFEVCNLLKQDERTCDIPILFISALKDTTDKVRAFEAGGLDYITKPFQEEEVLSRVRTHLKLYNMQRNLEDLVAKRTAELTESEQLARSLLNATTDLTQLIDENGMILDLNNSMASKLGGTREDLIGTCVFDRFSPEIAEERKNKIRQAIASGETIHFVDRLRSGFVYDTGIYPVSTPAEEKNRIVIFAHDITKIENASLEIKESEARFRATFEQAAVGIAHVAPDGRFLRINNKFCEIIGYEITEILEKGFHDITHPDDLEADLGQVKCLLNGEINTYSLEKRYLRRTGDPVWVNLTVSLVRDEAGQPMWFVAVIEDISDRKKTEEELSQIFSMSLDLLCIADMNSATFLKVNPRFSDLLGYSEKELLEKPFLNFIHPDDVEATRTVIEQKLKMGTKVINFNNRYQCKDGTYRWLSWAAHPKPEKGISYTVARDITEWKQNQEALKKSKELLDATGRMARVGGWELDADTMEVTWTEEIHRIHEVPLDYVPPLKEAINFFHPEDRVQLEQAIGRALDHGVPYDMEIRFITARGKHLWTRTICQPKIVDGKTVRLTGTFHDITERKKAESLLRNSEEQFKMLYEKAPLPYQSLNENGVILTVNQAWLDALGYKREDVIGKNFGDFLHNEWISHFKTDFQKFKAVGEEIDAEFIMVRKDGSQILVSFNGKISKDEKDRFQKSHCIFENITMRREAEKKLEKYRKNLESLVNERTKELRESEQKFRTLLNDVIDVSDIGVFILDSDFNVVWINTALKKYFGLKNEETIGKSKRQLIKQKIKDIFEDGDDFTQKVFATYDDNTYSEKFECHVLPGLSREERWLEHISRPVNQGFYAGGRIELYYDITDLKRAEEAERRSNTLYREINKQSRDGISIADMEGNYISVNPAFCNMTGYSEAELLGMNVKDLVPGQTKMILFPKAVRGEQGRRETELVRKDGTHFMAEIHAYPLVLENQKLVLGTIRDITESKRAERLLRESEERFNLAMQGANDGLWDWNLQTDTIYYSPRWNSMLGYSEHEVEPTPDVWRDLVHPDDWFQVSNSLEQYLNGTTDRYAIEFRMRHKEGGYIDILSRASVLRRNSDGKPIRLVGTHVDITERKRIERQIAQLANEKTIILENTPVGIAFLKERVFIWLNNNFAKLFGYKMEEMQGASTEICHPSREAYEELGAAVYPAVARGETYKGEWQMKRKNGSLFWCRVSGEAVNQEDLSEGSIWMLEDISEKLKAEEYARRQAQIMDQIHDSVIAFDLDGNIISWNKGSENLFQYNRYEAIGRIVNIVFPAESHEWLHSEIIPDLLSLESMEMETRLVSKDGKLFDALVSLSVIRDRNNNINSMIGYFIDISHKKQIERELKESENKFRTLFDLAPIPLSYIDNQGQVIDINAKFTQVFGYTRADIHTADEWLELAYPDPSYRRFVIETRETILRKSQEEDIEIDPIEYHVKCRNGEIRHVLASYATLQDAFLAAFFDISERKKTEEQLQQIMREQNIILETVVVGVALISNNRFVWMNQNLVRMFGYTKSELDAKDKVSLFPSVKVYSNFRCDTEQILSKGETYQKEMKMKRKDGSIFWCLIAGKAINPDRVIDGVIWMFKDISERKEAEKQLQLTKEAAEQASKAKSVFLASMSHELRTPLNAILGFAQLLARDPNITPSQQKSLRTINRSGEHLLSLINNVLDMSKIEAGRTDLNILSFDLHDMLCQLEEMIRIRIEKKNLRFTIERTQNVPRYIQADRNKLNQVLINLLGNAVKYTDEGGIELRILDDKLDDKTEAETFPSRLLFEIKDSGDGIAAADTDLLFAPFSRIMNKKKDVKGTGLGLYICRQFVQLMGGDIRVQSKVGQGSVFSFEIAISPPDMSMMEKNELHRNVIGLVSGQPIRRILVVDDDESNRILLLQLLESVGFYVEKAVNGAEALEKLRTFRPHLIWMDIRMPVLDGYEAASRIKSGKYPDTKIIALTAHVFDEEKEKILNAGFDDYVLKPFKENDIFKVIQKHLGVRYIYQRKDKSSGTEYTYGELSSVNLEGIHPDLLEDLKQAIIIGSQDHIFVVTERIRNKDPLLAESLQKLIEEFEFKKILNLIKGVRLSQKCQSL